MKQYIYNGKQYQFSENDVPVGAVELKKEPVEEKQATPRNKARTVKSK
ncbi:MAG: hypothetical protein HUJ95_02780 [Bacteroidales bacterium]|nr:hypothetical protein [Bacteroidales bacterium]